MSKGSTLLSTKTIPARAIFVQTIEKSSLLRVGVGFLFIPRVVFFRQDHYTRSSQHNNKEAEPPLYQNVDMLLL
jgi:hypothetical protein